MCLCLPYLPFNPSTLFLLKLPTFCSLFSWQQSSFLPLLICSVFLTGKSTLTFAKLMGISQSLRFLAPQLLSTPMTTHSLLLELCYSLCYPGTVSPPPSLPVSLCSPHSVFAECSVLLLSLSTPSWLIASSAMGTEAIEMLMASLCLSLTCLLPSWMFPVTENSARSRLNLPVTHSSSYVSHLSECHHYPLSDLS